jgi:hypothetical protein
MQIESKLRVGLILATMATASAATNIALALRSGRLAAIPLYDDVVYLNDAYSRVVFEESATIWDWAVSFISNPPHSPLSTLTGMIGYTLVGPYVIGPYLANIWILGFYVTAIYLISRRSVGTSESLLISAIFLFVPVAHAMINEFRPDMAAGLLMASSLYVIITAKPEDMNWLRLALLGLLAGAAVVAKPSAVVITVPLIGLAAVMSTAQAWYFGRSPSYVIRSLYTPVITFLMVVVPFGIIWGPNIVSYVTQALFTNADVWATPGGTSFHWTYHSFGEGGRLGLGPFLQAGLVLIVLDTIASIFTRRDRNSVAALCYYAILMIIYLGMSAHNQKTLFQGSFFYIPFAFGVVMALTRILSWLGGETYSQKIVIWSLGVTLVSASVLLPSASLYTNTAAFAGTPVLMDRVVEEIETRMSQRSLEQCPDRQLRFAALWPDPLNPDAVALELALKGGVRIDISGLYFERSVESLVEAAWASDFVLLPDKKHLNNPALPAFPFITEASAILSSSSDWSKFPMPKASGHYSTLLIRNKC